MASRKLRWPYEYPSWTAARTTLNNLALCHNSKLSDVRDLLCELWKVVHCDVSVDKTPVKTIKDTPYNGLIKYVDKYAEHDEKGIILNNVIPTVARCVLNARENTGPQVPRVLLQGRQDTLTLSRRCVSSVLACGFLCLFPYQPEDATTFPDPNFTFFFPALGIAAQRAKFRCITNYFVRLSRDDLDLSGNLVIHRDVLPPGDVILTDFTQSERPLCPLYVRHQGVIEDTGSRVLQVDFANRFIGGGVLHTGQVQEEIRFSVCPELLATMALTESMADNEAIRVQGFEQVSSYQGYGHTLKYAGNFHDPCDRDPAPLTQIVAIDAVPYFSDNFEQYNRDDVTRDLRKAYIGFLQPNRRRHSPADTDQSDPTWLDDLDRDVQRPVATGNWGCGAFGGDAQLKALVQWAAAAHAQCPALVYFTFRHRPVCDLQQIAATLRRAGVDTVGRLVTSLLAAAAQRLRTGEEIFAILRAQAMKERSEDAKM